MDLGRTHISPEPSLPLVERGDGGIEVVAAEVRPQGGGEIKLGIGQLPQHEVADARFAAGADQQIGRRQPGGTQERLERLRTQGLDGLPRIGPDPGLNGLDNVPLPTVVQRHIELQALSASGVRFGTGHQGLQGGGKCMPVAQKPQAHPLRDQIGDFLLYEAAKQEHERSHLRTRAAPVLCTERKYRHHGNLARSTRTHKRSHGINAGFVTQWDRPTALLRPATIAVHDHREMLQSVNNGLPGKRRLSLVWQRRLSGPFSHERAIRTLAAGHDQNHATVWPAAPCAYNCRTLGPKVHPTSLLPNRPNARAAMTSNPRAKNRPQTRAATDENGLAGEFPSPFSRRPIWVLSAVAMAAGACSAVHAQVLHDTYQLAPAGYSGAINTPTADVIRTGSAVLALSNSIPERRQLFPGNPFGGFNLGLGLLPGLEVVGRLVFDGDLQCNQFDRPRCQSASRDLSVSAKYQLPLTLPLDSRVAVGFTDYGGAATNFRQLYGVATTTLGPVDLSVGYSRPSSTSALMDGVFASATVRVNDQLAVVAESDTKARRIGAHYTLALRDNLNVQLGVSHRLTGTANQKANQVTAALQYTFDRPRAVTADRPAVVGSASTAGQQLAAGAAAAPSELAALVAERVARAGFENITVSRVALGTSPAALWWIQAEPSGWRKNHLDALGVGLRQWMELPGLAGDEVFFNLTHRGVPIVGLHAGRTCLAEFAGGLTTCASGQALTFYRGEARPPALREGSAGVDRLVAEHSAGKLRPDFELGASLRTSVGTEVGLFDYSAAVDAAAEVPIAKGLAWQGNLHVPVARSGDYRQGGAFYGLSHQKTQIEQSVLTYWRHLDLPVVGATAVQASGGQIASNYRGGQVDAVWMNPNGDWRVGATAGVYQRGTDSKRVVPVLASARHTVMPGTWHLEGTAGRFLRGDRGYQVASQHWFGDYGFKMFIRESVGDATMPRTRFAGFEFSVPLGPKAASKVAGFNVRGQDRFSWGLTTKIGGTDNIITPGYLQVPRARHGVWTDVTDYDRNGILDLWGNADRLRRALARPNPDTPIR